MMHKRQAKLLTALGGLVVVGMGILVLRFKVLPKDSSAVSLPATVFDASATVPNTNVRFGYPAKGFYGLGMRISEDVKGYIPRFVLNDSDSKFLVFTPTAPYEESRGSEYVVLNIGVRGREQDETLDRLVASMKEQSAETISEEYIDTGVFEEIGGDRFFMYKVTEDATLWVAAAVGSKETVFVNFSYKGEDSSESMAAYKENDILFRKILEHIEFE